jgi:hypothetical protein
MDYISRREGGLLAGYDGWRIGVTVFAVVVGLYALRTWQRKPFPLMKLYVWRRYK